MPPLNSGRRAFVTGITGQDGSYLADQLLKDGWEVHALVRPGSEGSEAADRRIHVRQGDLAQPSTLGAVIAEVEPDVVFNLGGISSVARSWSEPAMTAQVCGTAVAAMLDGALSLQESSGRPVTFIQASSAEIFGDPVDSPQDEQTAVRPVNPYGAAKAYAHTMTGIYRARGLAASSAILYNHESPRRPLNFVTRKITAQVAAIAAGSSERLGLGNLEARRDWGWAPDFVDAMIRMADQNAAGDYVIATGQSHSVRDFVAAAFAAVDIEDWERHVYVDQRFVRPADASQMCGDYAKAREVLGWKPTVEFHEIVARMTRHDAELLSAGGVNAAERAN